MLLPDLFDRDSPGQFMDLFTARSDLPQRIQGTVHAEVIVKQDDIAPRLVIGQNARPAFRLRRVCRVERLRRIEDFLIRAVILYFQRERELVIQVGGSLAVVQLIYQRILTKNDLDRKSVV